MSTKFRTVITTAGAAKLAAATAPGGRKVNITTMAVGDGGGKLPVPDAGQTGLKRIYTADEQQQQTESQKAALLSEAESVIQPLERAVRLNMATDEEHSRLEAWERYSVLVSRVDPANPEWPKMPQ
ncbi:hypothetical protein VEE42_00100 [Escherichia coli]|nr:hypothetical protein VEE42_00100 [Escherichia coli]